MTETLSARIENPFIVAKAGIRSGFSAAGDLFDLTAELLQIWLYADAFQHRLMNDASMPDGEIQKYRKTKVSLDLILARAADMDVRIAVTPVEGHPDVEALRALGDEIEGKVGTFFYHGPGIRPPFICVRVEEVRGKTGQNRIPVRLQLIIPLPGSADREIEIGGFADDRALTPVLRIPTEHIAVFTPGTDLRAAVPGIPETVHC